MKIAMVLDKLSLGGGPEHVYQVCKGMPDIKFGVFAAGGSEYSKFEALNNVTVFRNGYDKKQITSYKPDIVHLHHLRPLLKLRNLSIPVCFTVHGVHMHKYEFQKGIYASLTGRLRFLLEKRLYSKLKRMFFVSNDDMVFIKKLYGDIYPSTVVYNGMNVSVPSIDKSDENKEKYGLTKNKTSFLIVARFDFMKAYDRLLSLISKLNTDTLSKIHFDLIGDGELVEEMIFLAEKLGVKDYVTFHGKKENVLEYMLLADYFILGSRWEGLPLCIIESLSCGLPVIGSDTYGIREVCGYFKENCRLVNFDNEDEFLNLMNGFEDFALSREVDENLLNQYFGIEQMTKALRKSYDEIEIMS